MHIRNSKLHPNTTLFRSQLLGCGGWQFSRAQARAKPAGLAGLCGGTGVSQAVLTQAAILAVAVQMAEHNLPKLPAAAAEIRSEERRVGKECRSGWAREG